MQHSKQAHHLQLGVYTLSHHSIEAIEILPVLEKVYLTLVSYMETHYFGM